MANRNGGFINQDGLNAPDEPTNVAGTAGDGQVSVSFTAPSDVGGAAVTGYRVTDSTGTYGASGSSSPITVTGLTNGTSYTFRVWAINPFGWSQPSGVSSGVSPQQPVGLFAIGSSAGQTNTINKIIISTAGNAVDFGDLRYLTYLVGGCSSSTRGIFAGGEQGATKHNVINYVTISTSGNATDFGDRTVGGETSACSNSTRGVFAGGNFVNVMDYVTIASAGNATDFGDLGTATSGWGGLASPTRGVFASGNAATTIQYITIATTGNATGFGSLSSSRKNSAACSNSTRGVFAGGAYGSNVIDYITIASAGSATDFGDLTIARGYFGGCSSSTRGVFGGGDARNTIDYITIATIGNATDFGDLAVNSDGSGACSNAHGGLA